MNAKRTGKIAAIYGSVVDCAFDGKIPAIYEVITAVTTAGE